MDWQTIAIYLQGHTVTIVRALATLLVGILIARRVKLSLSELLKAHTKDPTLKLYVVNLVYALILVVLSLMLLGQLGVPTTSLITLLGASSLAVGLALKDSLSNIAGGLMLIGQKPFRIGDTIEVSGSLGTVDQINLFNTRIKTPNNEGIYIPNGKLLNDKINNKTFQQSRRLDLSIGISYDADLTKAKDIVHGILSADARILTHPAPVVGVKELADSALVLAVRPWVHKQDYGRVQLDLLEKIKVAFDDNQIEIPYQQLDITVRNSVCSRLCCNSGDT